MDIYGELHHMAQTYVLKAQCSQKKHHDHHAIKTQFRAGDRVFVFMPAEKGGKAYKFAKHFKEPYRTRA